MWVYDIALYPYIVNLLFSLLAFPYIKRQRQLIFSATVLHRHEKYFKGWSMKFSTHITIFNTLNKYSLYRDLCQNVGQMLFTLSFNVKVNKRTWCEFLLCHGETVTQIIEQQIIFETLWVFNGPDG